MTQPNATRLVTVTSDSGEKTSYWQLGEEVYRLNEYEPVQFNIYGVPLGARWETNFFHWPDLLKLLIPDIGDHIAKACAEAQLARLETEQAFDSIRASAKIARGIAELPR